MHSFYINGLRIGDTPPVLMGVLNISPESFFTGSYVPNSSIRDTAIKMVSDGAEILDIGARSTAPGSTSISVNEEIQRVKEALIHLEGLDYIVSIDTMYPEVLESALHFDICIANDISGLLNPEMQKIIADANIPAIIMATDKVPGDACSFSDTLDAIEVILNRAGHCGIEDIILDPGIGKWIPDRTADNDWELCRRFGELMEYGRPLLAAVSRKSFIGDATGRAPDNRLAGTLAVTTELIRKGASVIRTHDIKETKDVISVAMKLQGET